MLASDRDFSGEFQMAQWKERFLGISELPEELSDAEMEQFFRLSKRDVATITGEVRPKFRLAIALQLGFVRMSGRGLNTFKVLPRPLLKFVADQFKLPAPTIASIRALYSKRDNTRLEHQALVFKWLDLSSHTKRQERMLLAAVRAASQGTGSIDRLISIAAIWLHDRKLVIPALSTLREICVRASKDTEQSIYVAICAETTEEHRQQWTDTLLSNRKDGRTVLEWLQKSPKRRSPNNLKAIFEKIDFLTELGVNKIKLEGVPTERLQDYSRSMQHRSPSRFKRLAPVTQALQLISFLKLSLSQATDTVIQLSGKVASDTVSRAHEKVKKADAAAVMTFREALTQIFDLANNQELDAEAVRKKIVEIHGSFGVQVFPTRSAAVRSELSDSAKNVRPLLRRLSQLDVKGVENDRAMSGLGVLRDLYSKQMTELPEGDYQCPETWKSLIDDKDRQRALRAFEMSTLLELRKGFRRGSVWVDYSDTYRDRDHLLISAEAWERQRKRHYDLLRLPMDVDRYLDPLIKAAEQGLKAVAKAQAEGLLDIKDNDISLDRLEAEPDSAEVIAARNLIDDEIGTIQFPELLLEMDVHVRFSKELLGRLPRSDRDLLLSYAGLVGHGTDMTASGISLMMTELSTADVSGAMKSLEFESAIDRANQQLLNYMKQLPIMALYGDDKSASSDMMSLTTSRHLWNARIDPRRQTPSVGMYTHVSDRWPIIHHQPIVLGERQVGVAIEGVVRQTEFDLKRLAVDTHGYTDVGMAISHGLGFDLCPRLRNLRERRLTVPRDMAVPDNISSVVDQTLNLDFVRSHWDDLVRVLASINNGTVSAVTALQRFGSAAQGDPIYRAAKQLGRLLRTIYLCDYFTKPVFRREIHRVLNRGESIHTLQHAIHLGAVRHDRGRRPDELVAISAALTLLSNLVIAWNAQRMQGAIKAIASRGVGVNDDVLRHISPVRYASINFRGTFRFPLDRFRSSLLVEGPTRLKVVGAAP